MILRAPSFWASDANGKPKPLAKALAPMGNLYAAAGKRRMANTKAYRATGPVICVGNISTGGVGKTPFSLMLADLLKTQNLAPHFLSRGYGGKLKGPVEVDPAHHSAEECGDEPLLLAGTARTWIARERPAGANAAFDAGADIIIMDDGFQNPSLYKDFSFLLIDVADPFGNGQILPAGPLRERPEDARERADAIIFVVRKKGDVISPKLAAFAGIRPSFTAWLAADQSPEEVAQIGPVVAFAGIGTPEKFFNTTAASGYDVVSKLPYPDHYNFTNRDIDHLRASAKAQNATLLTTEKDFARLKPELRDDIKTLPVRMMVESSEKLLDLVIGLTGKQRAPKEMP